MPLKPLLQHKKVLILLGAGGVGKTSCSVSVALLGAAQGKRVALLSIDPAKRLAAALGIELGGELRRVVCPEGTTGTLDAAMIDQKSVFDRMVGRYAKDQDTRKRILSNPLYFVASTKLSGCLEFMALAQLQEICEMSHYDVIVVDTPPDTQALQFLQTPNILASFMEKRVMQWLIKPFHYAAKLGLGRLASWGERMMGSLAKVTGFQALKALVDFLILLQAVLDGFHQYGLRIVETLRSKEAGFLLVTAPRRSAVRSALHLMEELQRVGYSLDGVLLNRCFPTALRAPLLDLPREDSDWLVHLQDRIQEETEIRTSLTQAIGSAFCWEIEEQSQILASAAALGGQFLYK